jgi:ribonucleoside-diphosphate reductase alpha chain
MLDNTLTVFIETAPDSMEKARYSAMRERSVGLGAMGFHSLLQQEGIPWESDLARGLNLMVFSHIEKSADAASVKLAEERGAAPDMKPLKNRFAHKTAIAPNASSSIFIPDGPISPSIEPNNTNAYLHKTLTGSHSIKNRELEKLLRSLGQDTKEVWSLIIEQKGSVQHLDFLTDKQKLVFKTSREIDQAWVVRHAADRQQFIDQAQSVNLFYPSEVDAGEMVEHHFMAWAQGLKSLYYVRATAARRAENTNSKVERRDVETQPEESDCLACEG